ncbi:MAG TPA: TatD family hydrolase [Candidatus Limnocylindria bacterium]|nr:TatD family hydrolase [Candidatus Limnocylindria bacterium]
MTGPALLFDSHCHLDDPRFDGDREELLARLPDAGIFACLTCGSDLASSRASLELAERFPYVYAACGIHPHEAGSAGEGAAEELERLLSHPRAVAVGEIGLDFHYGHSTGEKQLEWLSLQFDLALKVGKPVILHVRDAHGAMLGFLRSRRDRLPPGVLHCFSGSAESAAEYEALGFHISFAGPVTFRNAEKAKLAAKVVSGERLLIETDSPYLAPHPLRGQRNDPSLVRLVCEELALLRGMTADEMARLTCRNACKLLGVPLPDGLA